MVEKATSLQLLDQYMRIPTISSQINAETIEKALAFWRGIGLEFELLYPAEKGKSFVNNPALYTLVPADLANAPTILLYGHWDVQPVGDLAKWVWNEQPCPPFEPTYFVNNQYVGSTIDEVLPKVSPEELGNVLMVGRGGADNKGQHLANILGVVTAKQAGTLKWNVKIILDGEEETGSPNLRGIMENHREKLKADFMVGSDGPKSDNFPTLLLGVRGLLGVIVRCQNGSGRMLHSGNYGNVVPSPILPLTRLLDEMNRAVIEIGKADDSFRQHVAQFFGKVSPDRPRYEPFLYPYFNVNSLMSEGATQGQRRTIIPSWIEASVDVRLTPELSPAKIYAKLEELTEQANREHIGLQFSIEKRSATAASYTSPEREGYQWLKAQVDKFWGEGVRLFPLLGGTLPNDVFTDGMGLAAYWLPSANSNNRQHDTNEHFIMEHFLRQQEFYATLLSTEYTA
jgi:acetylornithine deacetylase/succinyl-diaminopimelate desuccinylase-like protein